jgi:hypothetical protein
LRGYANNGGKLMETTLNVRIDIYSKINLAAITKGISRSKLAAMLIKKMMDDISDAGRIGRMVQYQKRCGKSEWHKFHLSVREDEYEYFLDLRKLLKMSVSLILSHAVEKYLDTLIKRDITDNNRYRNYIIIKDVINNITCWKLIWGFPYNIEKFLFK